MGSYFKRDARKTGYKTRVCDRSAEIRLPRQLPHRIVHFMSDLVFGGVQLAVPCSSPAAETSWCTKPPCALPFVYKSNAIPPSFCSAALVRCSFKKQTHPLPLFSAYFFCLSDCFPPLREVKYLYNSFLEHNLKGSSHPWFRAHRWIAEWLSGYTHRAQWPFWCGSYTDS